MTSRHPLESGGSPGQRLAHWPDRRV